MKPPRLYLDEDMHSAVAVGLRRRGYDVLTTLEAKRTGTSDEDQLRFAIIDGRALVSFNRGDFAALHASFLANGTDHQGIVLLPQAPVGSVLRALASLLSRESAIGLKNKLVWLRIA
ncbi:MAG: DUF5615 family PIN-like protein [Deltaproteobacteria bacterium]|nr:DUF5615 family PIN-like protein [Deltaproteobacteria bacterium]